VKLGPWGDLARTLACAFLFAVPLAGLLVWLTEPWRNPAGATGSVFVSIGCLSVGLACGLSWGRAWGARGIERRATDAVGMLERVRRDRDGWTSRALAAHEVSEAYRKRAEQAEAQLRGARWLIAADTSFHTYVVGLPRPGNRPGHSHDRPGVWNDGWREGTACDDCAQWVLLWRFVETGEIAGEREKGPGG
jgi:hypothetical protein